VRTRRAGTSEAVVVLGGQGPSASSPRLEVSPSPSCPASFLPQHLTVASSCGEKQPGTTDWLGIVSRASFSSKGFMHADS
jgi:hypothetical protein